MAGRIQKQDVKTSAELISAGATAADLINDTQIYVSANSINKTLSQAIIDNDLGGGGGGANTTLSNLTAPTAVNESLLFDAGRTIRTPNAQYILGRNSTNTADINMIRINGSNEVQVGATLTGQSAGSLGTSSSPWGNVHAWTYNARTNSGSDSVWIRGEGGQTLPSGLTGSPNIQISNNIPGTTPFAIYSSNSSSTVPSKHIRIETGNNTNALSGPSGDIVSKTGNVTNAAGTGNSGSVHSITGDAAGAGNSGDILMQTGSVASGARGRVIADARTFKIPVHASAPTASDPGEMYYDTTTNKSYTWDGATWQAHW